MKIHMLVFRRLVINLALVLLCRVSYANDACSVIGKYVNVGVEQSEISEKIFGIEREMSELRYVAEIENSIGNDHYEYHDYEKFIKCIDGYDSRFIKRNSTYFKLSLISVLKNKMPVSEEKRIMKYVIKELHSDDNLILGQAVRATVPFNNDMFIPYLKDIIINNKNNRGLQKLTIDMLSYISGSKTREAFNEIKNEISDPKLINLIDNRLNKFNDMYH